MSTKLEAMVGLLAGRTVEPKLLDELADPSSEASRFLEATRARSKALLDGPLFQERPEPARSSRVPLVFAILAVGLAALALFAALLWMVDRRFRAFEDRLITRDRQALEASRQIESALRRLAEPKPDGLEPVETALSRIEADLDRLERARPKADPALGPIRDELATLRRDLSATEKADERRAEEIQASVHDAARVLRLLLNRSMPGAPAHEPAPAFPKPAAGNVENRRINPDQFE